MSAGPLVAGGDELEEQVGGLGLEGDVADLVDDEQRVAAEPGELGLQPAGVVGVGEPGDPLGGGGEQRPGARPGRPGSPSPMARWVLPVRAVRGTPRCPSRRRSRGCPRWAITSRLRPRAWSKSNSSRRLAGREPGGADAALAAVGLAGGDLPLQAGGEELLVASRTRPGPARRAGRRTPAASGPSAPGSGTRSRRPGRGPSSPWRPSRRPAVAAESARRSRPGCADLDLRLRRPGAARRPAPGAAPAAAAWCAGSVMVWCLAQDRSWSATTCPPQNARTRSRSATTSIRRPITAGCTE